MHIPHWRKECGFPLMLMGYRYLPQKEWILMGAANGKIAGQEVRIPGIGMGSQTEIVSWVGTVSRAGIIRPMWMR